MLAATTGTGVFVLGIRVRVGTTFVAVDVAVGVVVDVGVAVDVAVEVGVAVFVLVGTAVAVEVSVGNEVGGTRTTDVGVAVGVGAQAALPMMSTTLAMTANLPAGMISPQITIVLDAKRNTDSK